MSNSPSETQPSPQYIIKCIKCDLPIPPTAVVCPQCGTPIAPGTVEIDLASLTPTRAISRKTTNSLFAPNASLLLRFLPLGQTLSLPMNKPLVLGRTPSIDIEQSLDLTDYGGQEHGISRQHCRLERRGAKLIVTDLASTNGTFINGQRLAAFQEATVSHGNRLILGTLHILVLFSTGSY